MRALATRFAKIGRRLFGMSALVVLVSAGPATLGAWVARPFDAVQSVRPALLVAQAATDTRTSDSPGSEQTKVAVATLFSNGTIQVM